MAEKTFEIEAESLEAAREKIKALNPENSRVLDEKIISDSQPKTVKAAARTAQAAFEAAQKQFSPDSQVIKKQEILKPEDRAITIMDFDEQSAREQAEAQAGDYSIIKSIKLVTAGKKGFLGIGNKPNQYQAELLQQAVVEVTFQPRARIAVKVDWDYTAGLRPLGNKGRLTHTNDLDDYDVRLLLFRDQTSAEKYYSAFLSYARETPPLYLMEIMLVFIPKTIYAEKYAIVIPNENADTRPGYQDWAMNAIWSCNETLRLHNRTDHKYKELHRYVEVVYKWDILTPKDFSDTTQEAQALLCDDPDNAFPALKVLGKADTGQPPEAPRPQGPWIGIFFEIERFDEALYGRAATARLLEIVGKLGLANCVMHGGDVLPEARYWCSAVHTASEEQAQQIERLVRESEDEHLAQPGFRLLLNSEVPIGSLPYQGFVSKDGRYVGV